MRRILLIVLCLCLLLCACDNREEPAPSTLSEALSSSEEAEETALSQESSSRSGYSLPSAPMTPPESSARGEKEFDAEGRRNESQRSDISIAVIEETDLDPEENNLIITLEDAEEILYNNLQYIEFLPENYGFQCEGICQINQKDFYYYFWFYDNSSGTNVTPIGYYFINGRTGQLLRHKYDNGVDQIIPLTNA